MSFPTFGIEVEDEVRIPFQEFGTLEREEDLREPSTVKDVLKQVAKRGFAGATGAYGDVLDLLGLQAKEVLPGEQARRQVESDILTRMQQPGYVPSVGELLALSDDDVLPSFSRLPSTQEAAHLVEMLGGPGEAETVGGRIAGRGAEAVGAGAALGGGVKILLALLGGGLAGQTAEELGAPPLVGSAVELATALLPGAISKKLLPGKKAAKELLKRGREIGLTERELTPLLKEEKGLSFFGKLARKGRKVQQRLETTREKLGDAYESIKKEAAKYAPLNFEQADNLLEKFGKVNQELRTTIKAAPDKETAIKFIEEAIDVINAKGATPEELINFYQDINASVNWNAIQGGKKKLADLKTPIMEALHKASPQVAKDFDLTNTLYSKFKGVQKALKSGMMDKWLDKGELGMAAFGLATGNFSMLKTVAGEAAGRTLATEMLTNPYFQNLSRKLVQSMNKNKKKTVIALVRQAEKYMQKHHPQEEWDFGFEEEK